MADTLYIKFLYRLYNHCMKNNGKTDIRAMVTERLSYDACYSFMIWAEQDGICSVSFMYDSIIIYLRPDVFKLNRTDYQTIIKKVQNKA